VISAGLAFWQEAGTV